MPKSTKVPSAVEAMKASLDERGCVAEVMEVGRRDQHLTLLGRKDGRDPLGLADDTLDVRPAVTKRCQQLLGIVRRPSCQRHGPTIPGQSVAVVAWDELRAALVAGASFSHRAQGGGIWPDGAGMPDPQPQAPHQPTRHLSRPVVGSPDPWPTSLALSL